MAGFFDSFFKLHYFVSHFMCALAALIAIVVLAPDLNKQLKKKLTQWGLGVLSAVAFFLCATGLGLALNHGALSTVHYVHIGLGLATFSVVFFFYSFPDSKSALRTVQITTSLTVLAVVIGVLSAAGVRYFFSPIHFLALKGEAEAPLEMQLGTIVDKKCLRCHNATIHAGKFNFQNEDEFNRTHGLYDGLTSKLYQRLDDSLFSPRHMPLHGGRLSNSEIAVVLAWIDNGGRKHPMLNVNQKPEARPDERLKHWSFRKSAKPAVPDVKHRKLVENEIDRFIVNSLEKTKSFELKPLDPATLARRVSLVLTGLQPTREERAQPYEVLKKKYLSSIGFAENFGLHWMDFVAFADDDGLEPSRTHKHDPIEFRKYLFGALKDDPSYFALLKEQMSPTQGAGGPNNKSLFNFIPYSEFGDLTVDSAMATTFSMALGLDMRCARCHDHPNEPITNENYYQLVVGFKNEFKVEGAVQYKYRHAQGPLPKPAFLTIFDGSKKPPPFDTFADLEPWLTDVDHGVGFFTARVFVDQTWKFVFGKSLMMEAGEFGATSPEPHYVDLLNWLTWDFLEHGTSIKYLVEKMISSRVFASHMALGSKYDEETYQVYQYRILRTENLRDNILAACGSLAMNEWTAPLPYQPIALKATETLFETGLLRSVYLARARTAVNDSNEFYSHFGISKRFVSSTRQEIPQGVDVGLFLLNQDYFRYFFGLMKGRLPSSISKMPSTVSDDTINTLYQRILFRDAKKDEIVAWQEKFAPDSNSMDRLEMMFRVLMSSNEFLYIP